MTILQITTLCMLLIKNILLPRYPRGGDPLKRKRRLLRLLLVPSVDLEPDRRTDEPEVLPDLVAKKALEREVQLHVLIGKKDERWRSHSRLRHVVDPNPLVHRYRSLLEVDLLEEPVHLSGGHALAPLS